jgi:immunoglobulin-binding protein 1
VNGDEDDIRSYHKATTQLAIMQTVQALGMVVMELDILSRAPPTEFSYCQVEDDVRSRDSYKDGYDEKLDSIPNHIKGGALISKDGKPLRPFTLLDKRQQLKGGVFGPGHNLPTITIDEYLEEERRRGGMMEGGGFVVFYIGSFLN